MIIELEKLTEAPSKELLVLFENGKLNVHLAFIEHGEAYKWLYAHSSYDLIAWEIENDCFNWEEHSCYLAQFCSSKFDKEKYNWKRDSWALAKYCYHLLAPQLYNWRKYSNR